MHVNGHVVRNQTAVGYPMASAVATARVGVVASMTADFVAVDVLQSVVRPVLQHVGLIVQTDCFSSVASAAVASATNRHRQFAADNVSNRTDPADSNDLVLDSSDIPPAYVGFPCGSAA